MANKLNGIMIISIAIFCFIGGLLFQKLILTQDFRISYISQGELIELEQQRLKGSSSQELFLGKPEKAIELIKEAQVNRTNDNNIVLVSEKRVYGPKVKSISREVHKEILKRLEK